MARESFAAADVAALLNEHYISVKVDREERPDIDHIYMKICQTLTGRGGWPLTIIMTPEKIPFFAGTYFPRERKYNLPGLKEILYEISRIWQEKQDMLEKKGRNLILAVQQWEQGAEKKDGEMETTLVDDTIKALKQSYDHLNGGFNPAPKFPMPHSLTFLLRTWARSGDNKMLEMVVHTLQKMRRGGIFDQLGYGFHRYSVDERWLVPHFEKMLYDQALLAPAYIEAYQATAEPLFADTAHAIFTYVLGEMQDRDGAFYTAENAESEGVEGKYYTWRHEEIIDILGKEEGSLICDYFGVTPGGNMEGKQNVLSLPLTDEDFQEKHSLPKKEWQLLKEQSRKKLLQARGRRIRPSRDEKILTSWNGLMISALARGGGTLHVDFYLEQARRAADFILEKMLVDDLLYHRYMEGDVAVPAFLEDHAFFCAGLLDLFEAIQEPLYLEQALRLQQKMLEDFWDEEQGGFFFAADSSMELPLTGKDAFDGATPSGNSVAALNLLRLAAITADEKLEQRAAALFDSFAPLVKDSPASFTALLSAYDFARGPVQQIVIAAANGNPVARKMMQKVQELFLTRRVLLQNRGEEEKQLHELCPYLEDKKAIRGKATAYLCQDYSCQAPVSSVEELLEQLADDG